MGMLRYCESDGEDRMYSESVRRNYVRESVRETGYSGGADEGDRPYNRFKVSEKGYKSIEGGVMHIPSGTIDSLRINLSVSFGSGLRLAA